MPIPLSQYIFMALEQKGRRLLRPSGYQFVNYVAALQILFGGFCFRNRGEGYPKIRRLLSGKKLHKGVPLHSATFLSPKTLYF